MFCLIYLYILILIYVLPYIYLSALNRGFGFVQYAAPSDAEQALIDLATKKVNGRFLRLELAAKKGAKDLKKPPKHTSSKQTRGKPAPKPVKAVIAPASSDEDQDENAPSESGSDSMGSGDEGSSGSSGSDSDDEEAQTNTKNTKNTKKQPSKAKVAKKANATENTTSRTVLLAGLGHKRLTESKLKGLLNTAGNPNLVNLVTL